MNDKKCNGKKIARVIRLKNRRIIINTCVKCGTTNLVWKTLTPHRTIKTTLVNLTLEAAAATGYLLNEVLNMAADEGLRESLKEVSNDA
jgi:predicted nucleic-acid-binding Zn-ribbon protein